MAIRHNAGTTAGTSLGTTRMTEVTAQTTTTKAIDAAIAAANIAANSRIDFTGVASHIEAMKQLNRFDELSGRCKIGSWDYSFKYYHSMEDRHYRFYETPEVVKNLVEEFKNMAEVKLTRTHGRTNQLERVQIAVYAKAISASYISRKFNVSLPTVYLYIRKYGPMV